MPKQNTLPELWRGMRTANPLREMSRLQRRIDRMFDDLFDPFSTPDTGEEQFSPPCDVYEDDQQYTLSFDLPGMKKDEIRIEVRDNQLAVSGERKHEHEEEGKGRYTHERYYGSFLRSFALPSQVNPDQVKANYENGVLQISLPKSEVSKGRQIPIRDGKALPQGKEPTKKTAA